MPRINRYLCHFIQETIHQKKKNAASNFEQVLEAAPHKAAAVRLSTSHHENYQS